MLADCIDINIDKVTMGADQDRLVWRTGPFGSDAIWSRCLVAIASTKSGALISGLTCPHGPNRSIPSK